MNNIYISFCGIDCNNCHNYKKKVNCQGCKEELELINDCAIRNCALAKNISHCGECANFSCSLLNDFYSDGNKKHQQAYLNMLDNL